MSAKSCSTETMLRPRAELKQTCMTQQRRSAVSLKHTMSIKKWSENEGSVRSCPRNIWFEGQLPCNILKNGRGMAWFVLYIFYIVTSNRYVIFCCVVLCRKSRKCRAERDDGGWWWLGYQPETHHRRFERRVSSFRWVRFAFWSIFKRIPAHLHSHLSEILLY